MRIRDARAALDHFTAHIEGTHTAQAMPEIRALPGETFFDPNGWRFATFDRDGSRVTVWRVGPNGGISGLYGVSREQIDYLRGLLA